ncbi:MAG: iron ABC transporter permease [Actinobacteria bacterium]|nr:iron ABC transporter permease [Actinomycetota bacterium]
MTRLKPMVLISALSGLVILALVANLTIGAYQLSISEIISAFSNPENVNPITQSILFDIRIPRLMLGVAIGVSLAGATTLMQTSMRNALADPALLGLAAASSFGVVVALVLGFDFGGIAAFLFALLFTVTSFLLLLVGHFGGRRASAQNTLLIGVALGAFFLGLLGVLATSLDNPQLRAMTLWSFGSLALATQTTATIAFVIAVIGFTLAWVLAPKMDLLLLGERMARTLGVETRKLRLFSLLLISLLVTAAVYGAGVIAFLGLFSVTVARAFVGPRHRLLLVTGSLISVLTILVCDLLARSIAAPMDLPIGFLTSLIGAPVLITILARTSND